MSSKKEIDDAIEQIGSATVHPIGKTEQTPDGPRMSLVIGGVEQTAKRMAKWQANLLRELEAEGVDTPSAVAIVSMTPEPKPPKA